MLTPPLLREAASHFSAKECADLREAYEMAHTIYEGHTHACKEPLLIFAEKVARLLLRMHPDVRTMITALLQFTNAKEELAAIEKRFGKRVLSTIAALTVLEAGWGKSDAMSPTSLRKMTVVLSEDIRVLLISLHNRLHLLEQASSLDLRHRRGLAREVLDVFAPLSARLGVYSLKYALESLAFSILYADDAQEIEQQLKNLRKQQGPFVMESARLLKRMLLREGKRAEILGREKHPYSIFRKMQRKGVTSMTELHDLFGLRVLTESIEDCYQVLGVIHRIYRPILHRMKDYIAFPKPNGYRSLHTTILGLNVRESSLPVEIQIRTEAMDEEAEYGIAAHWNYKEGGKEAPEKQRIWQERMQALKRASITTATEEESDSLSDLLGDRIYVLTPQGDPIELPKGATPLDFAFRVHTDIGLCFKAAKVNGAIAPIDQHLENGDMVEILKQSPPRPSSQWISLMRTSEARSKLRSFFRSEEQRKAPILKKALTETLRVMEQQEWRKVAPRKQHAVASVRTLVTLDSDTPLPHRFAKCCHPEESTLEHPPILGFITRGGVVTIHRKNCRMLRDANAARCIRAAWRGKESAPSQRTSK